MLKVRSKDNELTILYRKQCRIWWLFLIFITCFIEISNIVIKYAFSCYLHWVFAKIWSIILIVQASLRLELKVVPSFKFDETKAIFFRFIAVGLPIVKEENITILTRVKNLLHFHPLSTFDFTLHWIGYLEEEFAPEDVGFRILITLKSAPKSNNCNILISLLFTCVFLVHLGSFSIDIDDEFGILIVCDANSLIDCFFKLIFLVKFLLSLRLFIWMAKKAVFCKFLKQ